ncbi:MAG TPA: hypothetical protein VKZ53_18440 [Candidatus Angelobacter sp.]|nr:hypothetical protein [Candidatus Angelobacter sp.]
MNKTMPPAPPTPPLPNEERLEEDALQFLERRRRQLLDELAKIESAIHAYRSQGASGSNFNWKRNLFANIEMLLAERKQPMSISRIVDDLRMEGCRLPSRDTKGNVRKSIQSMIGKVFTATGDLESPKTLIGLVEWTKAEWTKAESTKTK